MQRLQRLTGIDLYQHHQNFSDFDGHPPYAHNRLKIIAAGYSEQRADGTIRVYYTAYYEAYQAVKNWLEAKKNTEDNGGRKVTQNIVKSIRNKVNYKKRNDEVVYFPEYDATDVYYYGSLICIIHWGKKVVELREIDYRSKSTKERLNRILMALTGCQLFQKNKEWYVYSPTENKDILFYNSLDVDFIGPCPE